jgi:putative lipoic acid-binding regulatory protein
MVKSEPKPVLKFPCEFPLKVIGLEGTDFEPLVTEIVRKHVPDLDSREISSRLSSNGKYRSVSFQFIAKSKTQMDELYQELTANERIAWVL